MSRAKGKCWILSSQTENIITHAQIHFLNFILQLKIKLSLFGFKKQINSKKLKLPQEVVARLRFAHMKPNMRKEHWQTSRPPQTQSSEIFKTNRAHTHRFTVALRRQHSFSVFLRKVLGANQPSYLNIHTSTTVSGSAIFWTEWVNKLPA